ncbi:phosphatidylglycerophosphatase A [uncultured Thiodictyon sp.]|jgi:phosphatidylglycerophosphatase A|uniref:phosphatidylglycerophosphatase A family protein n=1 Tax=uncultured Thiodictyon sp. TaxID=1846217 RepID=UPI0034586B79
MTDQTPTPLTDFTRRAVAARALIQSLLTELIGPVDLKYDFFREWNGCWKARVDLTGAATGRLEFTFLSTPGGGLLALPRPLPERWRLMTGIPADDGTRWTLDAAGLLVPFAPPAGDADGRAAPPAIGSLDPAPGAPRPTITRRDRAILFLAQGFGTGRLPKAPGTFGTLPGVLLYLLLAGLPLAPYLAVTAALLLIGIPLCGRAARTLGEKDPPSVVWDEIVGYLITMIAITPSWPAVVAGFAAFRLFDIWKPWPIGWIDRRVGGGLGIMLDDVVAGLMALGLMHLGLALVDWI